MPLGDFAFLPAWEEHPEGNDGDEEVVGAIVRTGWETCVEELGGWGWERGERGGGWGWMGCRNGWRKRIGREMLAGGMVGRESRFIK